MKKILFVLAIVIMSVCAFSQNTDNDLGLNSQTPETLAQNQPNTTNQSYDFTTAGQLLERAGKLKNTAIAVGIGAGIISSAAITINAFGSGSTAGYVIGGGIAFVGGIVSLVMEIKSNNLIQDAGRQMTKIQFQGNGVTINF